MARNTRGVVFCFGGISLSRARMGEIIIKKHLQRLQMCHVVLFSNEIPCISFSIMRHFIVT